ncbi:superoxide dismutase family protein [Candidatus Marinamargulisbacteria bacterium SCGC AG-343-D04]|nr:superoxide dismutase family protein [Candidatus Marinamargulisbacteria bacterium SCGC AG-343-D04]
MRKTKIISLCLSLIVVLTGCLPESSDKIGQKAIATLQSLNMSQVSGIVVFEQLEGKVKVTAKVKGLNPNAKHGFHVHHFGDLSKDDGTKAGGHYNPEGHDHGLPPSQERHAGSFGNIQTDSAGNAIFSMEDETISISGDKNPILGRSVIIHAKEDDGGQPSGNAGKRIAGGVIGLKYIDQ